MIPLKTGAVVNFAESIDTVPENIREYLQRYLLQFQGFGKSFIHRLQFNERCNFHWQVLLSIINKCGSKYKEYFIDGKEPPLSLKLSYWICNQLVLKNIKKLLGLNNCRYALSGAAPISPDLINWYLSWYRYERRMGNDRNCWSWNCILL